MDPVPIPPGSLIRLVGDSNTVREWDDPGLFYGAPLGGGIKQRIDAVRAGRNYAAPTSSARLSRNVGYPAVVNQITDVNRAVRLTRSGVSGDKIAGVEADIPGRILAGNPETAIMFIGLNDATGAQGTPTTPAAYQASANNIMTTCRASAPAMNMIWLSIFGYGFSWSTVGGVPSWGINQYDQNIADIDGVLQASCTAFGYLYIDLRTPLLAFLAANNVPEPGLATGFITNPGDPNHPIGIGQAQICQYVAPHLLVIP